MYLYVLREDAKCSPPTITIHFGSRLDSFNHVGLGLCSDGIYVVLTN